MKGILAPYSWLGKLLIFVGMLLLGGVIFQYAALLATDAIFPAADVTELFKNFSSITSANDLTETQIHAMKCFQFLASFGQYIIIPFCFVYLCGDTFSAATGLHKTVHMNVFVLVFFIFFSSIGVIGYVNDWNQNISLPAAFSSLENSMRTLENQAQLQTDAFLKTTSTGGLLINILMIAVLAAVGEEIVFRGLLQNMLQKMIKNVHVAVWSAACIFSFMHFQFFGFFPRLILGAVLGYLFAWSGSLWPSVAGHFINNFLGVLGYFLANKELLDENVTEQASWQFAAFSLPFFLLFLFLYKRATEQYRHGERLDDGVQY